MSVFQTIICSINLIERSDDLVYYTRELAKLSNAKVYVVHSLPALDSVRMYAGSSVIADNFFEETEKNAKEHLTKFIAENFPGVNAEAVVTTGKADDDLLALADKFCAELIIVGSMSTKGLFGFISHKTSQAMIGKTRIPVMVVPNDLDMDCVPE